MDTPRRAFWAGVLAEGPILLGVLPFGLIYGVLALGAGLPPLLAQAMSMIVFAGSSQFVIAQLAATGAPGLAIIATAAIINLRHALYSASLAPHLRHPQAGPRRRIWRWLLGYLLTDEAYAVAITRYTKDPDNPHNHWFFFGAGMALWTTWQASTAAGVLLGGEIPGSWSLDFTLALTFIAIVVPGLRDRPLLAAALTGGAVAVLAAGLPYKLGLIVAAFAGIAAGLLAESLGAARRETPRRSGDEAAIDLEPARRNP